MRQWIAVWMGLASVFCTFARGATFDVTAQDQAGVQAALRRAHPGDVVRLAAGMYTLGATLTPPSGVRLTGAGSESTVLQFTGERAGPVIKLEGVNDVEIDGLTIDGHGDARAQAGIYAHDSHRLKLHDLRIVNLVKGDGFGPIGIHFDGDNPNRQHAVTDSVIADCAFDTIGVGAEYGGAVRMSWGSSRNRVVNNRIANTGRGGIFADDGCTDLVIRGNTVRGSGGEGLGIEMWNGCERAVIEDNQVDHWISLDKSNYSAVRRNTVTSDPGGVIKANGLELVNSSYVVLTDNVVDGGQHIGISVSGEDAKEYVLWAYDRVRRCQTWGAQLQGERGGVTRQYFYKCTFMDTIGARAGAPLYPDDAGHGLRLNGNVRAMTFEACNFAGNAGAAVQLGGDGLASLRFVACTVLAEPGSAGVDGHTEAAQWTREAQAVPAAAGATIPSGGRAGEAVAFAAAPGDAGAKALWDFGEGPAVAGRQASHAYEHAGRYRVTLVVWPSGVGQAMRLERYVDVAAGAATATTKGAGKP